MPGQHRALEDMARRVVLYVALAPLILLSVGLFGAMLGLAVKGILEAQQFNTCGRRSNGTNECIEEVDLLTAENDTNPTTVVIEEPYELEWVEWLAGSTGCAILWSVITTLGVWLLVEVLRKVEKKELRKREEKEEKKTLDSKAKDGEEAAKEAATALQEPPEPVDNLPDHADIEFQIDVIGAYQVKEWLRNPLRHLDIPAIFTVFFSLLAFILALMCLLWGVALSYYHTRREDKNLADFVVIEILVGIALPLFLFIGATLLAIVLDFVTIGRQDLRTSFHRFLPSVELLEGQKQDYWVIEDRFYFVLEKKRQHLKHGCLYSCDKAHSTWLLAGIVSLSLLLSFSYFVDISVVEVMTRSSCPEEAGEYDCFNRTTFNFVDCEDEMQAEFVEQIHCFRFLRFAVDRSIISSVAQSFAFYLVIAAFFARIFSAVKVLLQLKPSRFWGVGFILLGGLAIVGAVVFLSVEDTFLIQVDTLSILQAMMVCVFLMLVGVLLLEGKWWQKVFIAKRAKPLPLPLVHYGDTTAHELHEVEHEYAAKLKKEDPTLEHELELRTQSTQV